MEKPSVTLTFVGPRVDVRGVGSGVADGSPINIDDVGEGGGERSVSRLADGLVARQGSVRQAPFPGALWAPPKSGGEARRCEGKRIPPNEPGGGVQHSGRSSEFLSSPVWGERPGEGDLPHLLAKRRRAFGKPLDARGLPGRFPTMAACRW